MSTMIRAVRPPEESARAYSYRVLVMYICEMFFLPGERLVEADIAAQLGVSRTPVHDTFLQLIHEKMLCTGPRSVYVPLLDPENIRQSVWMLRTTGVPRCERCGGVVKPYVVLYGEAPDKYTCMGACREISLCDVLIVAGTSLEVEPAASFLDYFHGRELVVINREEIAAETRATLCLRGNVAEIMGGLRV